jgi:polar amino acid transport system ATP-binding protein
MPAPKLRVIDVHKSFRNRQVLQGIDLALDNHDVVCLIGPSGCGKSTLLRCIDLLEPIDSGSIELDGVDISANRVDPHSVRRRMGMVFQGFNLFPHMDVLSNVTLAARKVHGVPRAEAEERARALLDRFGLAAKAREFPERISGGQQQRVAVVRALMAEPELLLLDEITSALDPELVGEVLEVIRELADGGMTMVLATHEMGFAREVATRIAFLHEGRVLECSPPDELFEEPKNERTRQFLRRVREAGRI